MELISKKIFSKVFLRTLFSEKIPLNSIEIISEIKNYLSISAEATLFDFFEKCFEELSNKENRIEYFYKNLLINKYIFGIHNTNTSRIIHELHIRNNKADILLLTKKNFSIFEIKSEKDTLLKLQDQLDSYYTISPLIYIITAEKHLERVIKTTNKNTGILICTRNNTISTAREASEDYSKIKVKEFIKILKNDEAKKIYRSIDNNKAIQEISRNEINSILSQIEYKEILKKFLSIAIESRKLSKIQIDFNIWPPSLYSFLTSTKITKKELDGLKSNLLKPINQLKPEEKHDISQLL